MRRVKFYLNISKRKEFYLTYINTNCLIKCKVADNFIYQRIKINFATQIERFLIEVNAVK
ncbi:hypothetical protein GCM10007383_10060 [Arenibacter certesii]|uniref:Uncharacterized protein n=1 Tax=Arenibacter certesii TaxID=228955 RepID=A0A918IT79_9FLAO|nr:hypothetical protein GCM10007383_10060 [Arenibacter certesii]